jgi:hypothetical protein
MRRPYAGLASRLHGITSMTATLPEAARIMKPTRRPALAVACSLAFLGVSMLTLLGGCGQEPAGPATSAPPPPAPSPPQVESPSQANPSPMADQILTLVKDRSSRHTAQVVQRGTKQVVILDGQSGPEYDQISEVTFSADGNSLVYEAKKGKEHLVVLDGKEWPLSAQVVQESFLLSPDNKRLALVAWHQDKWQVMVDGRPDPPFDFIFMDTLKFSPDSKHTGYLALMKGKLTAVMDGKVRGQWDILAAGNKTLEELLKQAENIEVPPKVEVK